MVSFLPKGGHLCGVRSEKAHGWELVISYPDGLEHLEAIRDGESLIARQRQIAEVLVWPRCLWGRLVRPASSSRPRAVAGAAPARGRLHVMARAPPLTRVDSGAG